MRKKNILIIGNIPPPIGGVSIYVRRRLQQLITEGNTVAHFPSRPSLIALIKFIFCSARMRFDLIEINSIRYIWMFIARTLFPYAEIVVIDHNDSSRFNTFSTPYFFLYGLGFLLINRIDLVRNSQIDNFAKLYFYRHFIFSARSPFIEPTQHEEVEAISAWPVSLHHFVKDQRQLIVSCAYSLDLKNDIYNFIDCITAFAAIKRARPDARLVLVSSFCDSSYKEKINVLLDSLKLNNNVYFQVGAIEIWPLFKNARVLLRITTTDGDSVSVKEALAYQCKVVASNVVKRPDEVSLVNLGKPDEIASQVIKILTEQ